MSDYQQQQDDEEREQREVRMKAPRFERQQILENALRLFSPDANEATELLDAVRVGLRDRYRDDELVDVFHEMDQLHDALEELERTTTRGGLRGEYE